VTAWEGDRPARGSAAHRAGVFGLWLVYRLPGWVVFVLVVRDVYLGYGAWRLEQFYHRRLPVTFVGKITTALLMVGFADLVLGWPLLRGVGLVNSRLLPGLGARPAPSASGSSTWRAVLAGRRRSVLVHLLAHVREAREGLAV